MGWEIRVTSETHDQSGKRRKFSRRVPVETFPVLSNDATRAWIEATLPALFYGCAVHVTTPLHHDVGVVDPDTRKFFYTS